MQVLEHEHILPLIIKHGARKKARAYVHQVLMVEAVNTTMGGIAQEVHDEVLEYILKVLATDTDFSVHISAEYSIHWFVHTSAS